MFTQYAGKNGASRALTWKGALWALVFFALPCTGILSAQADADPERLHRADLSGIAQIVQKEIQSGRIPGAVILVGNEGRIVYRQAFGYAELEPERIPMGVGTLFDLASLTKVVATTTAVMQLVQEGKLDLNAPAARYWPAFGENGKEVITVRELLTHYSGLAPDLNPRIPWRGYRGALGAIIAEKPVAAPGSRYLYSDINFEALGEIVRRVSGEPLDVYCTEHIFGPLHMRETTFRPPAWERYRIAPTEYLGGKLRWGKVHDPTAYRMGGVSGHAGLFSTAGDLAIFAQMLLNGGTLHSVRILDRRSVGWMTIPQSPPGKLRLRGLGWDLAAPFAPNRDDLLPVGAYDHTGFTGTLLWIDPVSRTYVIILTNRVYPFGKGNAGPLRKAVVQLVSSHLGPLTDAEVAASRPRLGRYYAMVNRPDVGPSRVQTSMGGRKRHYVQKSSGNRPVSG
ncbi:serine hydrolase domain-containing protein [Acidithiobacillus sp.]|uniref:serine hydrolase domain-containing protein n=1 Tax=Acidithiobacillus sp. TaxID=1872118 RepID=UPI002590CD4D|nr:serine hydrolase domain-containing protein [Acidithiobacillus sp.]MDD5374691.1 serine hydrolase [Acidithiobacillus sp.]